MADVSRPDRNVTLIAALVLAVGIVIGGYLLGDGLRRARMADRAVTVRGLAERDVTANLANWTVNFTAQGTELAAVQTEIDRDAATVVQFFRAAGFPADAVTDAGGSVTQYFDSNRGENNVTINRRIQLRTTDVMRARQTYARQFDLIRRGVAIQEGSAMQYVFTRLNAIKPEMIAEATQDARRGAERFASDSGTGVGGIRSATQGYFSIGPRDGDSVEDGYGGRDSPFQKVRVVTTIEFYLD
ncbi:SIMPL domain-containing protein [Sphingosinicella sp. CPCC 101087]|uniref:SIMPL domain-containing protein n=1 Tax=Sphingosinicella sp. CPCC 101087 TaxID=2497754 RepID=UPI00101DBF5A|nr:SIMPL domain-containing protein [Sphingosinicella sp. CPCC 101087]